MKSKKRERWYAIMDKDKPFRIYQTHCNRDIARLALERFMSPEACRIVTIAAPDPRTVRRVRK